MILKMFEKLLTVFRYRIIEKIFKAEKFYLPVIENLLYIFKIIKKIFSNFSILNFLKNIAIKLYISR